MQQNDILGVGPMFEPPVKIIVDAQGSFIYQSPRNPTPEEIDKLVNLHKRILANIEEGRVTRSAYEELNGSD